jgi:hypothetical protein
MASNGGKDSTSERPRTEEQRAHGLETGAPDPERAVEIARMRTISSSYAVRIHRDARFHRFARFTQMLTRRRQGVNTYGDSSEQSSSPQKFVLQETPHVCHL